MKLINYKLLACNKSATKIKKNVLEGLCAGMTKRKMLKTLKSIDMMLIMGGNKKKKLQQK